MAPEQVFFLRENLKLRLLHARLGAVVAPGRHGAQRTRCRHRIAQPLFRSGLAPDPGRCHAAAAIAGADQGRRSRRASTTRWPRWPLRRPDAKARMRAALWLLALFGIAAAVALFAGNNQGTITVFWPPWRVDLSLNLVLLLLLAAFIFLHLALRGLAALFSLPRQARQWRLQQKERALYAAMLDAAAQLLAGRFPGPARPHRRRSCRSGRWLRSMPCCRRPSRCACWPICWRRRARNRCRTRRHARRTCSRRSTKGRSAAATPARKPAKASQLRAARWALEDRDAPAALARLEELPQGAQRRTLALRVRLKAARLDRRTPRRWKPGACWPSTAPFRRPPHRASCAAWQRISCPARTIRSTAAGLGRAGAGRARDARGRHPSGAAHGAAARRPRAARAWLLPVWERMAGQPQSLGDLLRVKLVRALEAGLDSVDADWLARIESAQRNNPRDPNLQYLAGMACMRRQLWGKAQQLINAGRVGLAGCRPAPPRLAGAGAAGRGARRCRAGRRPPGSEPRRPKTPSADRAFALFVLSI